MERRYLTVFIAILVVSLLTGVVWNAVLDISSHSSIAGILRKTFEVVKANDAEEFVEITKLVHSMIYQDYEAAKLAGRIEDATDIYATFRNMAELKSASLIKVIDRITCLAAVTFKGADGKDITHHIFVVNFEDREGNLSWAPHSILRIEAGRSKQVENLLKLIDEKNAREKAKKAAEGAVAGYVNQTEGQIGGMLGSLQTEEEIRDKLVKVLEQVKTAVPVKELVEKVDVEKAVETALEKLRPLADKLQKIMDRVEPSAVAEAIRALPSLGGSSVRADIEKFVAKIKWLRGKAKSAELVEPLEEATSLAEKGLLENLSKLAEKLKSREDAKLARELSSLATSTDKDKVKEFLDKFGRLPGSTKLSGIAKSLEEIIELAAKGKEGVKEKLQELVASVDISKYAEKVKRLTPLAATPDKKNEFIKKAKEIVAELKAPEPVKLVGEALQKATSGNKELMEKFGKLAESAESPELAGKVAVLLKTLYMNAGKLEGTLSDIVVLLVQASHVGRLKDTDLIDQVLEAKTLANDKALDPLSAFDLVRSPRGRYLQLVARLKAIGEAEDVEKKKAEVQGVAGQVSGGLKQAAGLWVKLKTPYAWHYKDTANKLAGIAPTEELKEEANKAAKAAREAIEKRIEPDLPDLSLIIEKVKTALLEESRIHAEKFKALAKLARKNLQNAATGKVFAAVCMLAADIPEKNPGDLVGQYAELAAMPVEMKCSLAGVVAGVITNKLTRTVWEKHLKLTDKEKAHGLTVALMRLLDLKSMEALVKSSEEAESQEIRDTSKNMAKTVLEVLKVIWDEYMGKSPTEKDKLVKLLIDAAHGILELTAEDLDLTEAVEGVSKDALDSSDLYEARDKALRKALRIEKNRRGSVDAKMRKRIELLTASFPGEWAGMKGSEQYMEWAFPAGKPAPESSGLGESGVRRLVEQQEKFASIVVGKKVAAAITHHWYPDPENGFQKTDTRRMSEIVRVKFQTNPDAEKGSEEYTVNDFMLLQEMAPDWSVKWKLYRACNLYEYDKCWKIVEQEFEKRKAYFADGKVR